jgi:glutathionyl-hydroquinone reductase
MVGLLLVCSLRFTEADLRLFPTIVRFDAVYAGIFKCGRRRVADYPHLQAWMKDVYQIAIPGCMKVSRRVAMATSEGWYCLN